MHDEELTIKKWLQICPGGVAELFKASVNLMKNPNRDFLIQRRPYQSIKPQIGELTTIQFVTLVSEAQNIFAEGVFYFCDTPHRYVTN